LSSSRHALKNCSRSSRSIRMRSPASFISSECSHWIYACVASFLTPHTRDCGSVGILATNVPRRVSENAGVVRVPIGKIQGGSNYRFREPKLGRSDATAVGLQFGLSPIPLAHRSGSYATRSSSLLLSQRRRVRRLNGSFLTGLRGGFHGQACPSPRGAAAGLSAMFPVLLSGRVGVLRRHWAAAHIRACARANSWACGQADAMATLMRRTETRT